MHTCVPQTRATVSTISTSTSVPLHYINRAILPTETCGLSFSLPRLGPSRASQTLPHQFRMPYSIDWHGNVRSVVSQFRIYPFVSNVIATWGRMNLSIWRSKKLRCPMAPGYCTGPFRRSLAFGFDRPRLVLISLCEYQTSVLQTLPGNVTARRLEAGIRGRLFLLNCESFHITFHGVFQVALGYIGLCYSSSSSWERYLRLSAMNAPRWCYPPRSLVWP